MGIMSNKKFTSEHFVTVKERIKSELGLKTDKEIFQLLEIPQSTFSRSKENEFPAEWAFKIARKKGLSTDWIMTGEGEKKLEGKDFFSRIKMWVLESSGKGGNEWFENQFREAFPMFERWEKREETGQDTQIQDQKKRVA